VTTSSKKRKKKSPPSANREYYPAFLNIHGRQCVIIGGGKVAERKCSALLRAGARVTVISPEITQRLQQYREEGLLDHVKRRYRKGDMESAFAVIVATDCGETNQQVGRDAARTRVLLNVVDIPSLCNFIAPSVIKRGPLTIAVSTGGVSPAMARTIRRELEMRYGAEFSGYLRFMGKLRKKALEEIRDKGEREQFLKGLASEEMITLLRREGFRGAKKTALKRWQALQR
jgi:precorrin-2 dehydrogenase/sirohydrochlorin ferrochelatase